MSYASKRVRTPRCNDYGVRVLGTKPTAIWCCALHLGGDPLARATSPKANGPVAGGVASLSQGAETYLTSRRLSIFFRFCPLPYRGDWAEAERDVNPALDGSSHSGASSTGDGDALALRG